MPAAAALGARVPEPGGEAPDVAAHPPRRGRRHGADGAVEPEVEDREYVLAPGLLIPTFVR